MKGWQIALIIGLLVLIFIEPLIELAIWIAWDTSSPLVIVERKLW